MRVPCFIPYVNRPDLLRRLVPLLECEDVKPVVINNSGETVYVDCEVIEPPVPLTFTQSQNWMLKIAKQADVPFYMWAHVDALPEPDTSRKLYERATIEYFKRTKWGVIYTHYDILSACCTDAMDAIGGYDTAFFDYCSDQDAYRRLDLAGYARLESGLSCGHDGGSTTLKSDPRVARLIGLQVPYRSNVYMAKWGGHPGSERFLDPYNEKEQPCFLK